MMAKCSLHWREGQSQLTGFPAINHHPKVCLLSVKNTRDSTRWDETVGVSEGFDPSSSPKE